MWMILGSWPVLSSEALASLQSTGAQKIGYQEQVQHQIAKSTKYREQQPTSAPNASNKCDQRPLHVCLHRGPQLLATPDGLQPLPGGWHNHDSLTLDA